MPVFTHTNLSESSNLKNEEMQKYGEQAVPVFTHTNLSKSANLKNAEIQKYKNKKRKQVCLAEMRKIWSIKARYTV